MTSDERALLIDKYFSDEATDLELEQLFLHLSASYEGREEFSNMKFLHESLMQRPNIVFPSMVDNTFAPLKMGKNTISISSRQLRKVSMPLSILAGVGVFILSLLTLTVISRTMENQQINDRQSASNSAFMGYSR